MLLHVLNGDRNWWGTWRLVERQWSFNRRVLFSNPS